MANWSGTYTITAGTTGTSTGGNTSTTFNNTGATWPTGAQGLPNFTLRILTGTGAGQSRIVASNTATQITVSVAWGTIPDTSSTYEIVLILKNSDHVTAAFSMSTNIITELEDSATILIDGNFAINVLNSCITRWQKTLPTMVTFEPNNRTVAGLMGFWSQLDFQTTASVPPVMEYIKLVGATSGLLIRPNAATTFNGSTVKHIWIEGVTTSAISTTASTFPTSITYTNMFAKNGRSLVFSSSATASANALVARKIWFENGSLTGGFDFTATGPNTQTVRESVFKRAHTNQNVTNTSASIFNNAWDCYFSSFIGSDGVVVGHGTPNTPQGTYAIRRCVSDIARVAIGGVGVGTGTLVSAFNDIAPPSGAALRAIEIGAATAYASATSDNDYFAGNTLALPDNVDTSASTSSTASPSQYNNLTSARTNAKSVRNRPRLIDNVVAGSPGENSITVTFDCANGAVSGQGSTTVNVDSASGQPILSIASVTGFTVGEIVEVGHGTARYEALEVLTVGASSLTFTTNLAFSHTAAQADTVKKQLRLYGLPFIRWGTSSGVYTERTATPDQNDWGLVFTEISTSFNGQTFAWKMRDHSVVINGLAPSTTFYGKAYAFTPLGDVIEAGSEFSFTTTASSRYTDPGIANVRLGTTYKFNSLVVNRTGNVRVPVVSDVRSGVVYDTLDTLTGTFGDGTPPTFAGITSLTPQSSGALLASWAAATDGSLPITYFVYIQANTATGLFSTTPYGTQTTSLKIFALPGGAELVSGTTYFVGVRAIDGSGNLNTNTVSLSAVSSGVQEGAIFYESHAVFSINNINELLVTGWMTANNAAIKTGLGTASLEIRDAADTVLPAFTQSGIAANADGAFIFAAVSAALLDAFTHYRVKITIIQGGQPYEASRGLTIFE